MDAAVITVAKCNRRRISLTSSATGLSTEIPVGGKPEAVGEFDVAVLHGNSERDIAVVAEHPFKDAACIERSFYRERGVAVPVADVVVANRRARLACEAGEEAMSANSSR
jgi:hypothetical protein